VRRAEKSVPLSPVIRGDDARETVPETRTAGFVSNESERRDEGVGASRLTSRASTFTGFYTLFYKEWLRFWKVKVQTVLAPVLTALLFLLVFGHTLRNTLEPYPGVGYTAFLVPGLAMMAVL
jgi:hypothetical protein